MRNIIVAHPDKQHSFHLATALKEKGMLQKYITTVYDKPSSLTHKVIKLLSGKDKKKALSRSDRALNDTDVVQFYEWANLLVLFFNRITFLRKFTKPLKRRIVEQFGIQVAKYAIRNNAEVVVMYDNTALSCFRYLKEHSPQIIRVLDTSIVSHDFKVDTFDHLIEVSGDDTIRRELPQYWEPGVREQCNEEISLSQYFLVASEIVKRSVLYQNKATEEQIFKIPYGVDTEQFHLSPSKKDNHPRKLLFCGQVTCRKGINLLLDTLDGFDENEVELYIAGAFNKEASWYAKYAGKKNVHFLGFVTRDIIADLFASADAFVLPSYAEGLALVGLEALASSLPIICSQYSGVNDLVENGVNGFEIDVFEEGSLKKAIQTIIDLDPAALAKMSLAARATAEGYTWKHYDRKVQALFEKLA